MNKNKIAFAALLLLSFNADAQIVIGPPGGAAVAEGIPTISTPILLCLGAFLAYMAHRFKLQGKGNLPAVLWLVGAFSCFSTVAGITLVEKSQAGMPGANIRISTQTENSYPIEDGEFNYYENNSGIELEVKSIQYPGSCRNLEDPEQESENEFRCAAALRLGDNQACHIIC